MRLLKMEKQWVVPSEALGFLHCGAVFPWLPDNELREAMLAANVNILRREAPYIYLFAADRFIEEWLTDTNPYTHTRLTFHDPYLQSFEQKQLHRGIDLMGRSIQGVRSPAEDFNTTTVVTALLLGDVLPVIPRLYRPEYTLLCLPQPITLEEVDSIVLGSSTIEDCHRIFFRNGGCCLSIVDHTVLQLTASDHNYGKYFTEEVALSAYSFK